MKAIVKKTLWAAFCLMLTGGAAGAAESEFCLTKVVPPLGNNCSGDDLSAAYFSWSTEDDGTVSVAIMGLPGNTATAFRGGTGMKAELLKVSGKPGVTFTGAFTDATKTAIIYTPSEPLEEGDELTYNGLVEYKTADAPAGGFALQDLWPTLAFTHTFGDVCVPPEPVKLSAPANIAVSDAGALTFDADANANRHELVVYRGSSVLPEHVQTVTSGDVIQFHRPGSYTLTVQSISASPDFLNSAASERYVWSIAGDVPPVEVGETVFCSFLYSSGDGDGDALFTWETIDGNIVIRIAPVDDSYAPTAFRGNGTSEAFTVNGLSGSWFTRTISVDKTEITLTPKPGVELLSGDTISYAGEVEYLTKKNGNLYPTINFAELGVGAYIYGSRCPQAAVLETPAVTGITSDGVITFTEVANATRYALKVYRESSELLDYTSGSIASGDAIDFRVPGEYTVTVQAIGDMVLYHNSEPSEKFAWTLENAGYTPPSTGSSLFCSFALDPQPAVNDDNDRAVFSWETRSDGAIVVSIAPDEDNGNFDTYFRGDGMRASALEVNGQGGEEWFSIATNEEKSEVIFTPNIPLRQGDRITYNGLVEYRTGKAVNDQNEPLGLWSDVNFGGYGDYIYGSGCAYAPAVVTDKKTLEFSPDAGVKTFTVSAVNLVSPLVIVAPQGLSVHPDTVYPLGNGSVPATPVEVRWEEGSSAGGVVRITGGGLAFAKEISVNATGFSDYCNKVLNYWGEYGYFPAYLSVGHTEGSVLSFTLAPVYGEAATWNNNSIQAGKVTVSRAGVTVTDRALNENEITLTFSEPLQAGDVVSIGPNPAFVWTTQSESGVSYGNCYIDPLQTYTVGASCELVVPHPAEKVAVQSVEYASTSFEGGQATVVAANGTYPVASIRFWEENGKLPYREVGAAADGAYEISGLEPYNTYSINVAAVDEKGYASDPVTLTIKNLGTLVADDFPFEHTVTYDGLPHAAEFTSPDKAGEVTEVLYNSSPELPVAVGSYTVTIDVLEGDGYHAASGLSIGTLSIVRGGVGRHLLEYAIAAHTYSGEPYPVEVSIKPDVEGAGEVTAVKYNGSADVPANAGAYAVTVDVSEGENFDATVDLLLDTLHILRAATTVDKLTWTAEDAVYSGEPNVAVVQPAEGVVGLGEITLRYNDGTEAVDAGRYTVFADVAQGENYEAATGVEIDSFTIGKATLAAEHFTFPPTMPYDGTPRHLPVTLVEPYTGEGIITVKYDGSETPPVESGSYAVSVSVAEGSNFVATIGDVELGSFAVQTEYSVTVQVSDVDGHRMISPPFTVTLAVGDVSRSLTTVSGQAAFEGVPRHSAFTVSAAAAGYTVSASVVGSLQSDTTIVLTATEESSLTAVAEEKSVLLSAYVAGSVLHISPDVESVRMVNVAGVVALDVPGGRGRAHFASTVSLAHLPSGIYFVLLRGGGEAKTLKVVLLNYEL